MSRKPNLLFVFADQMRGMAMGCAGNSDVRTPTMDALARDGLRLTDCTATSPVCSPNRATMLTGVYPTTHRVLGNDLPLRLDLPSLGTVAKENGYHTGYIGKWHLDGVPRSKFTPPGPRRFGFDFWAVYNCTHAYFRPTYYRDSAEVIEAPGYEPEVQTDLAIEFLDQSPADAPFCLVLSWGPPHDPYDQVPERARVYDPTTLTLRPNVQPETDNPLARGMDCRRTIADYYTAVTALDKQLGRLLAWLDERGSRDDTVVVFTSDHGDMLWSHGLMKKQAPHEESINVPFLLRWPGRIAPGSVSETLVGSVDLLPTLVGLLGWETSARFEGRDLSAAFQGHESGAQDSVLIGNYLSFDEARRQNMPEWRGVRTLRYTYAELPGRRPWLLFDNQTDPYQLRNLVDQAEQRDVRRELASTLGEWLERTADPFLPGDEMVAAMGLQEVVATRTSVMQRPAATA